MFRATFNRLACLQALASIVFLARDFRCQLRATRRLILRLNSSSRPLVLTRARRKGDAEHRNLKPKGKPSRSSHSKRYFFVCLKHRGSSLKVCCCLRPRIGEFVPSLGPGPGNKGILCSAHELFRKVHSANVYLALKFPSKCSAPWPPVIFESSPFDIT